MIQIYYVQSTNVNGDSIDKSNRELVKELSVLCHTEMEIFTDVSALDPDKLTLVFIGGGGTEGRFKEVYDRLPRPVLLLTTGANNSLAASMEILSYLRNQGERGEIIHGGISYMAERISLLERVFAVIRRMRHFRIGRVGVPSDWLISSDVDASESKKTTGIEIVDVEMSEFFEEINKAQYEENKWTRELKEKNFHPEDTEKALEIYGALKRICEKYSLDGVTVRCFDLLEPVKNTGCAALAILNAEGIYAGCEGDTPALIAMSVIGELSKKPVFMANPSRIDKEANEIIFAHCTLPLNMPRCYTCMTHFESGLGVAFRGEIEEGDVTVFKCSGLLDRYFVSKADLKQNLSEANLCRTQIRLKMDKNVDYFLRDSIGNHHLIVNGDYTSEVEEFFRWF